MTKLGIFSGKIYKDEECKNAKECCLVITEEQAKDENFIENEKRKNLLKCCGCFGCPMSKERSM